MEGFSLLLGHLIGDYIFQNDWMARNKTSSATPMPLGERPGTEVFFEAGGYIVPGTAEDKAVWDATNKKWHGGLAACTVHCLLYTLSCFLTCFWFLPWWSYPVIFLTHWPVDRFRLARKWMIFNGQEEFATGVFSPWSIIVVDNIIHLLVLFGLGMIS